MYVDKGFDTLEVAHQNFTLNLVLYLFFVRIFGVNNSRRFQRWLQYKRRLKTAPWDPEPFRNNNFEKWGRLPSLANIIHSLISIIFSEINRSIFIHRILIFLTVMPCETV